MQPRIDDMFKPGDVVIADISIDPFQPCNLDKLYNEMKRTPLWIDMDWKPPFLFPSHIWKSKVKIEHGDRLVILSKAIDASSIGCRSFIFQVHDKDGNEFYCSCEFFREGLTTDLITGIEDNTHEFESLAQPL
jgi:hypothetical protein